MTRSKLTLASALAALLFGATLFSAPAMADKKLWEELNDEDGSVTVLYKADQDGSIYSLTFHADGTITYYGGEDNPTNDATGRGSHSEKPDVIGLIKSGKGTYTIHLAPADSAKLMGVIGGGPGPLWNPGDDDNGRGPGTPPDHSKDGGKTAAEIRAELAALNATAKALAAWSASMGSGDEGGTEGPLGFNKGNGGGNNNNGKKGDDDDGSNSKGKNTTIGKTEKDLLGPKPEYVNPPHFDKTGRSTKTSKTDKGDGLSVTGKGLLDGNGPTFNQNGPSAIGSVGAQGGGGGAGRGAAGIR